MVNRNAIMVKPKQPFVDWINSLDENTVSVDVEQDEHPVYLLPECDSDEQFQRWLRKNYRTIFENELRTWWTDESAWPAVRSYRTFCAWFDVAYGSEVFDLGRTPLIVEDL